MNFLSKDERELLKAQHRKERDRRICDRIKAVLLYDKGWSFSAISEALLLSGDAIRNHISEYQESRKLKPENGGSVSKLSLAQSQALIEHLSFFDVLSNVSAESTLGKNLRSRIRDKFSPIGA